jgi:aryl-alcohol dehydrogenase-like predicted oxidoreductase
MSKLVLGTVQFGLKYGIANRGGQVGYDEVKRILSAAVDGGIDTLDTAASYGESEAVLGRAMAELGLRDKLSVVSKVRPVPAGADAAMFVRESVEGSLRKLGLERLPLVLLHHEEDAPHLPLLAELKRAGLIGGAGISIDRLSYPREAEAVEAVQHPCNVLDHRFDGLLARRAAAGRRSFFRSAYMQGLLLMPEESIRPDLAEVIPWRRKLAAFGLPLKELCLRYVLSQPGDTGVLFGVDSLEQLRENLKLAEKGPLPADLFAAVKAAVPLLPETLIRPHCWNDRPAPR